MQPVERRVQRLVPTGTAVSALLSLPGVVVDWRELRRLAADTDWALVPVALGAAALAYAALTSAFAVVGASVDA